MPFKVAVFIQSELVLVACKNLVKLSNLVFAIATAFLELVSGSVWTLRLIIKHDLPAFVRLLNLVFTKPVLRVLGQLLSLVSFVGRDSGL